MNRETDPKELQRVIVKLEARLLAKERALIWAETQLEIAREDYTDLWVEYEALRGDQEADLAEEALREALEDEDD